MNRCLLATAAGAAMFAAVFAIPATGQESHGSMDHSAAANMSDLLASLNSPATGVGLYGSFGLDANGVLSFTSSAALPVAVPPPTIER